MIRLFLLFILTLVCAKADPVWQGQAITNIIPLQRLADWTPGTHVGVLGGIPTGQTIFTNLVVTNGTDITMLLSNAVVECPSNQVVFVPAGNYLLSAIIYLSSGKVIRGAGMHQTLFGGGGSFFINGDSSLFTIDTEQVVSSGLQKGSTNISVADTSTFVVGRLLYLARFVSTNQYDNPLVSALGPTNAQNGYLWWHVGRVTSKTSSDVTFWPPLPGDMSDYHARVKASLIQNHARVGFESFTMNLTNVQVGISMSGVRDCWVKNVRIRNANNYSVTTADSVGIEITGCWLDDLNRSGGSNGAGLLNNRTCGSLYENNIVQNAFPDIEINAGSCGNVYAYNFLLNTNGLISIDSNHGPHNSHNLFEGNVAESLISDGYFGSEAFGTVYRNWFHGKYTDGYQYSFSITNDTFAGNDQLTVGVGTLASPYLYITPINTQMVVTVILNGSSLPSGLSAQTAYYMRVVNITNISLHTSAAGAVANTDRVTISGNGYGTIIMPSIQIGYTFSLKRMTRSYSVVGNIMGMPLPWRMTYDGLSFGQPNMGNSEHNGTNAPPWPDWLDQTASNSDFQELDINVEATLVRKANFLFYITGIPENESIGSTNLIDSLYRSSKPSWWGDSIIWPKINYLNVDTNNMNMTNIVFSPSHQAWLNGGVWLDNSVANTNSQGVIRSYKGKSKNKSRLILFK